jgi:hypothetical protein
MGTARPIATSETEDVPTSENDERAVGINPTAHFLFQLRVQRHAGEPLKPARRHGVSSFFPPGVAYWLYRNTREVFL